MSDNITLDQIGTDNMYDLISLYERYDADLESIDSPFIYTQNNCDYYEADKPHTLSKILNDSLSYFHINCRGLSANWNSLRDLLCDLHNDTFAFDIIGISEVYRCEFDSRLTLPGYHDLITRCRCNRLRCPLARMSGLQCFNMGHNGHGINLYGVSMTLMVN